MEETKEIHYRTNWSLTIILIILLGILFFVVYKQTQEIKLIKGDSAKLKLTKDSLQAVRIEANNLANDNDSLATLVKDDKVLVKYVTRTVYINAQTNEEIKTILTASDSTIVSTFSRLLTDSTFTKGSGVSSNTKKR